MLRPYKIGMHPLLVSCVALSVVVRFDLKGYWLVVIGGASQFCKYLRRGEAPDGSKSLVLTNKLSAEMLRPCQIEIHPEFS